MIINHLKQLLTFLASLFALWLFYYIYIMLPGYVLVPIKAIRAGYPLLNTILKLDYGRFLGRLIRLGFVITVYAFLIGFTPLKKSLQELLTVPKSKSIFLFASIIPCLFIIFEFFVAWQLGWISNIHMQINLPTILLYSIVMFCTAMAEELAFRGITIAALKKSIGVYAAVIIQALYFGFGHWYCTNELIYGVLTTIAGLLFGCMVIQTRSLWPAIIFHWSWNLSQILLYSKSIVSFIIINHYWLGSRTTPDEEGIFSGILVLVILIIWLMMMYKTKSSTRIQQNYK